MKNLICLIMLCAFMALRAQAAPATTDQPGYQLTVEMRDGSRVIGQNLEQTLSFRSATLGDMKLPWSGIRAVEYTADTDTTRLTATNGDALTIQLSTDTLPLETGFGKTELPVKQIRSIKVSPLDKSKAFTAPGVTNKSALSLTIELRDGSRLVGKGLDDALNFHTTAMGDLKLTWAGIRSIEFPATGDDSAQLRTVNGDLYKVQFVAPSVRLETSFGKNEVPVKLIGRIHVSREGGAGEHLIGWWKLDEGTGTVAKDSSNGETPHDGNLVNGPTWTQDPGAGDTSLQFSGPNQYVSLGNILQGSYPEISIACWVKRVGPAPGGSGPYGYQVFIDRGASDTPDGIRWAINGDGTCIFGHYGTSISSKVQIPNDQWHHIVGTISPNGSNYNYNIYVDGKLDNTATISMGLTATTNGWAIGAQYDGGWGFSGQLEDVRIYDRALSASEVEAIYAEQNHGGPALSPPPTPPAPVSSPATPPNEANFNGKIGPGEVVATE